MATTDQEMEAAFQGFTLGEQGEGIASASQTQQTQQAAPTSDLVYQLRALANQIRRQQLDEGEAATMLQALANAVGQGGPTQGVQQTPGQNYSALEQEVTWLRNEMLTLQTRVSMQQATQQATTLASSATPLLPKLKLDLPDKFSGDNQQLRSWALGVKQYSQIKGLDSRQTAALAVTLLKGRAKTWWESKQFSLLPRFQIGLMLWEDLLADLESAFADPDRERRLLSRLQAFSQKGDLNSYVANFRSLRMELGDLITDAAALWAFVGGLKIDLRREVLRQPNITVLEDAILAAERADATERFVKYGFQGAKVSKRNDGIVPMDIDALLAYADKRRGNQRPQQREQPSSSNAGARPKWGQNKARPQWGQKQAQASDECFYCGKKGHWAANCFKKQRAQGKRLNHVSDDVAPPAPPQGSQGQ